MLKEQRKASSGRVMCQEDGTDEDREEGANDTGLPRSWCGP